MHDLAEIEVRKAKPKDASYKLVDGGGLYLFITPKGAKSWRYDYRLAGRRQTLTIGQYGLFRGLAEKDVRPLRDVIPAPTPPLSRPDPFLCVVASVQHYPSKSGDKGNLSGGRRSPGYTDFAEEPAGTRHSPSYVHWPANDVERW